MINSRTYMSTFAYLKDLPDPEPRGWNIDNKEFTIYDNRTDEPDDNEIVHPYQDEFEEDECSEDDTEYVDEPETTDDESDTSSVKSVVVRPKKKKFTVILQEEEFVPE